MDLSSVDIKLNNLAFYPYLNAQGIINLDLENKIGVYAIFDQEKNLQYVGYSRNLLLSLKQHLVRQLDQCYWFKYYLIERPNRTILEEIRQNWLTEGGLSLTKNQELENIWTQPIDIKLFLTMAEKQEYENCDELGKIKLLKKIARREESKILSRLDERNAKMEFRFNPKLKEEGLLDLK